MSGSLFGRASNEPDGLELRPTPRTTRLNRNALLVGGALAAAVIAAAAATLVENRQAIQPAGEAERSTSGGGDRFWEKAGDGVPGWSDDELLPDVAAPPPGASVTPIEGDPGVPDGQSQQQSDRLARAYAAAPLVGGFRSGGASPPTSASPAIAAQARAARAGHPPLLGALSEALGGEDEMLQQNNQEAKREFLTQSGLSAREETNPHTVREPASRYEVTAGMVIPAVLLTQAESDLPGLMSARVTENVWDSATGQHRLIPQGTTLVGVYDSVVTYGQQRLLIAWQRLLPDGTKLNVGAPRRDTCAR